MCTLIARVIMHPAKLDIEIVPEALRQLLQGAPAPLPPPRNGQRVVLAVPAQLRRAAGETRLIAPGRTTSTAAARPNPALIKALVRAHAGLDRLCAGTAPIAAGDLATTINLACLAPDITQAILDGTQPEGLTLELLRKPLPLAWHLGLPTISTATTPGLRP